MLTAFLLARIVGGVKVPEFVAKNKTIVTDEAVKAEDVEAKDGGEDLERLPSVMAGLPKPLVLGETLSIQIWALAVVLSFCLMNNGYLLHASCRAGHFRYF